MTNPQQPHQSHQPQHRQYPETAASPETPPVPAAPPRPVGPMPPGSVYDTSLTPVTSLPPLSIPQPPDAPGSIYDTGLASAPLPPLSTPPLSTPSVSTPSLSTPPPPIPPWAYDGDRSAFSPPPPGPRPTDDQERHQVRGYDLGHRTPVQQPVQQPVQPSVLTSGAPYRYDQEQQAVMFESAVRAEIKQLESYFARQTRRFRLLGVATLVCAAAVPVLIAAGVWSWLAAAMGAIAAISGSLQTLYRYQDSALSAMNLANNLESELVRYQTGTTPYLPGAPSNFNLFVDRTTHMRGEASANFTGVWSSAQISSGG